MDTQRNSTKTPAVMTSVKRRKRGCWGQGREANGEGLRGGEYGKMLRLEKAEWWFLGFSLLVSEAGHLFIHLLAICAPSIGTI